MCMCYTILIVFEHTKVSTASSTAKLVRWVEWHWTNEPLLDGGSMPSDDQDLEVP